MRETSDRINRAYSSYSNERSLLLIVEKMKMAAKKAKKATKKTAKKKTTKKAAKKSRR